MESSVLRSHYDPQFALQPHWLFVLFHLIYGSGNPITLTRSRSPKMSLFLFILNPGLSSIIFVFLDSPRLSHSKMLCKASSSTI